MNLVRNIAFAAFDFLTLFFFLIFLFWSTGAQNVCEDEYYTNCFSNTSLLAVGYFLVSAGYYLFLMKKRPALTFLLKVISFAIVCLIFFNY